MRNTHPQLSVTSSVAASRPETLLWPVESHYEIRVINRLPVILPAKDSKFERTYDPMLEARLCEQFSSVYDQRTLLKFVSYYGLLGFSHLVQPEKRVGGDPVPWALAHARRVRAAFRIVSLLKEAPASRIKKLPASLPGILKDTDIDLVDMRTWFGTMAGGGHRQVRKLWSTSSWPSDPLGTAWEIVRRFINPGIERIHYELVAEGDAPRLKWSALIEVIYWRLISELGNIRLHRCEVCHQMFRASRVDAKTCSTRCRQQASRKRGRRQ